MWEIEEPLFRYPNEEGKDTNLKNLILRKDNKSNLKEHEKHIYVSDVSSVSISFRDAHKHTMDEIIKSIEAADRINKLAEK